MSVMLIVDPMIRVDGGTLTVDEAIALRDDLNHVLLSLANVGEPTPFDLVTAALDDGVPNYPPERVVIPTFGGNRFGSG